MGKGPGKSSATSATRKKHLKKHAPPPEEPVPKTKKDKKDIDEDDAAFKERKKAEAEALKAARDKGTSTYPTIPTYRPHSPTKSPSLEG